MGQSDNAGASHTPVDMGLEYYGTGRAVSMNQVILDQLKILREEQRGGFESLRAEFNSRIDRLVSVEAFAAEQTRVNDKFSALTETLKTEQAARVAGDKQLLADVDKLSGNIKWVAGTVLVPTLLFFGNIVFR